MHGLVANAGAVASAVRDVLEHHRCGLAVCRSRQEQPHREPAAVAQGDPLGLDLFDQVLHVSMGGDAGMLGVGRAAPHSVHE